MFSCLCHGKRSWNPIYFDIFEDHSCERFPFVCSWSTVFWWLSDEKPNDCTILTLQHVFSILKSSQGPAPVRLSNTNINNWRRNYFPLYETPALGTHKINISCCRSWLVSETLGIHILSRKMGLKLTALNIYTDAPGHQQLRFIPTSVLYDSHSPYKIFYI